jgi:hypothetical protein
VVRGQDSSICLRDWIVPAASAPALSALRTARPNGPWSRPWGARLWPCSVGIDRIVAVNDHHRMQATHRVQCIFPLLTKVG